MKRHDLINFLNAVKAVRGSLTDEQAVTVPAFFSAWKDDAEYAVDDKVRYGDKLYRCLQAHQSQPAWTPEAAPSLWARVLIPDPEVIPDWEQPESTNGYSTGDKVRYKGKVYESLIDNNVWAPDTYPAGWKEITE